MAPMSFKLLLLSCVFAHGAATTLPAERHSRAPPTYHHGGAAENDDCAGSLCAGAPSSVKKEFAARVLRVSLLAC